MNLYCPFYRISANFPKQEVYGLTSQFRKASVSIPANIAEGYVKKSKADKMRFFNMAQGSLEESRYYCILVKDLDYGDTKALLLQIDEVGKLLNTYVKKIKDSMDEGRR